MKAKLGVAVLLLLGALGVLLGGIAGFLAVTEYPRPGDIGSMSLPALVEYYELRGYILLAAAGIALLLTGIAKALTPAVRWVRVGSAESDAAAVPRTDEGSANVAAVQPSLVQVFHSAVVGAVFLNASGPSRQSLLSQAAVGDVVVCRCTGAAKGTSGEKGGRGAKSLETVGLFTMRGEQLGYLDRALLREIRVRYPGHRIGASIERLEGGDGRPYTCYIRVGVYRV